MLGMMSVAVLLAAGPAIVEPDNLESTFQSLKEAVAQKDASRVKTLAVQANMLARNIIAAPAPEGDEEKTAWNGRVTFAHEVELFTEYSLYTTAIQSPPAITVALLGTLEQQNPDSKYLTDAYGIYFYALRQTDGTAKIPAIAEKAIGHFPNNDDLLLVMAESAYGHKQMDRALGFAKRLTAAIGRRARPEGMTASDWEHKRSVALASG